jgi:hypothetical protein
MPAISFSMGKVTSFSTGASAGTEVLTYLTLVMSGRHQSAPQRRPHADADKDNRGDQHERAGGRRNSMRRLA